MRDLLQALLYVILVLDMCLLGMFLAQWQQTGNIELVFEQNFGTLFHFLREYATILK